MRSHFEEMRDWVFPMVARTNRAVTIPVIRRKTGLNVVSAGANLGEVVTNVDLGVSQALLHGGIAGVEGVARRYPGSFTEEQDSKERLSAMEIFEIDPIDGTGDLKKTFGTDRVMSPTTLVTKLRRRQQGGRFEPVCGMIFHVLGEYALIGSVDNEWGLFTADPEGNPTKAEAGFEPGGVNLNVVRLNRRTSYPQQVFDEQFVAFLRDHGLSVLQVATGGAGLQALQVFRRLIRPESGQCEAFEKLEPLDISFNCQPDWKCWDTDPVMALVRALTGSTAVRLNFDTYGDPLTANASEKKMCEMWHEEGTVLASGHSYEKQLIGLARLFREEGRGNLLSTNY